MSRNTAVVAVVNHKGGVGKTATAVHLAAASARRGSRVALIDLDPQASLTFSLGFAAEPGRGTYSALVGGSDPMRHLVAVDEPALAAGSLHVLPAGTDLAAAERDLAGVPDALTRLKDLTSSLDDVLDLIVLDCPPTLGFLTLGALIAARHVVIPVSCDMLSHRGVGAVFDVVADTKAGPNRLLNISAIIPTMYDGRLTHARAIVEDLIERYQPTPLLGPIPRSVRAAEAPAYGATLYTTAPKATVTAAYDAVASDLLALWGLPARVPGTTTASLRA